jgi:hypothetical protein
MATADSGNWDLTGDTAYQAALAERGAYLRNRAMDDIRRSGNISGYTQEGIDDLRQTAGGAMAFANSPAVVTNLNANERGNVRQWLSNHGYAVDRIGSNVQMDLGMNADGELIPTGMRSFEGHRGQGGFSFSDVYGHTMDMGITPDIPLIVKQNGRDLAFVGGRLTGYEGGYHEINDGVTRDGQLINGRIGQNGELIQTTHPSALQVTSSSMLNLLSREALPESHMNVKDNPGAAVEAWMGAVRTYASHEQLSNRAYAEGLDISGGFRAFGSGVKVYANKSIGETIQIMENQMANNIREKIEGARTNQEALDTMQREYRNVLNHMPDVEEYGAAHPDYNAKEHVDRILSGVGNGLEKIGSKGLQEALEDRLSKLDDGKRRVP